MDTRKFVVQKLAEHSPSPVFEKATGDDRWEDLSYQAEHDTLQAAEQRVAAFESRPARIVVRTLTQFQMSVFQDWS